MGKMLPVFMAALAVASLPALTAGAADEPTRCAAGGDWCTFSARCTAGAADEPTRCSLLPGDVPGADATGSYQDNINQTGWGQLLVRTRSEAGVAAFAAGFLEGALTAGRVTQALANLKGMPAAQEGFQLPPGAEAFIEKADRWARAKIDGAGPRDRYWNAVRFEYEQLDGLVAGANSQLDSRHQLRRQDVLMMNMQGDLPDIATALNASKQLGLLKMPSTELASWVQERGHCSALVKLVPDGTELFVGHNSWVGYHHMLRIFKRYEFGDGRPIAMSSYPGVIASGDDFYQIGDMVVLDTTISNFNPDLTAMLLKPEALSYWVRAMVANRLASSGPEWMDVFKKHNGGTYNSAWSVVDYSKFTPGQPLPRGVLTFGEQMPGDFHYEDMTATLAYGYWPSYNVAFFPETQNLAWYEQTVKAKGTNFSYQEALRAQVFRRDQATIQGDQDMQRVMRYNQFQTDPLAHGDPCGQLACRADLNPVAPKKAFGAIDAKYTSFAHVRAGQTVVISGPTHDDQPVFDWASAPAQVRNTPHVGQPDRWEFGWVVMDASVMATPWPSPDESLPMLCAMTILTVAVTAGVAARACVIRILARARRCDDLHDLEKSFLATPSTCASTPKSFLASPSTCASTPPPLSPLSPLSPLDRRTKILGA